jgi:hypothetical protein
MADAWGYSTCSNDNSRPEMFFLFNILVSYDFEVSLSVSLFPRPTPIYIERLKSRHFEKLYFNFEPLPTNQILIKSTEASFNTYLIETLNTMLQ